MPIDAYVTRHVFTFSLMLRCCFIISLLMPLRRHTPPPFFAAIHDYAIFAYAAIYAMTLRHYAPRHAPHATPLYYAAIVARLILSLPAAAIRRYAAVVDTRVYGAAR